MRSSRWWPVSCVLACAAPVPEGASEIAGASSGGSAAEAISTATGDAATTGSASTTGDVEPAPTSGDGATTSPPPPDGALLLLDGHVVGLGVADLRVADGTIVEIGELTPGPDEPVFDLSGRWVAPAFVDSHVHLLYLEAPEALAAGGVAGAVDLAAPVAIFDTELAPLRVAASGPMVTAVDGYPTQSWGANGYGLECADAKAAAAAVELLHDLGAAVIKLPVTGGPQLADEALAAAAARAHELGLLVVSHALTDADALRAAKAGADVLAHTPTGPLTPETVAAWSDRAVISTLRAFGGSKVAVDNLAALRAAGATVLYGTDFGNSTTAGIDPSELALLTAAGLSPAEILAAGTTTPADLWAPLASLGRVEVGKDASLLVLAADPLADPQTLGAPVQVFVRGALQ
jgi:imidazolonepropionase-like amidohydrolase